MRGHTRHSRSHFSLAFGAFKTLLTSSLLRPRTQALAPRQQQLRKAWPIYQIAKLLLDRMVADSDMAFRLRCVPKGLTMEDTRGILSSSLKVSPDTITIFSIARDPIMPNEQVCTLSLEKLPEPLRKQSVFHIPTVPRSSSRNHDSVSGLVLDTDFGGFTPLHYTFDEDCTTDIVAVCGLNGHALGSFKQKSGPHVWLRDSLPMDFRRSRIFTYGYDTRNPSA